ncbi:Rho termination factor N-terminal domain-containing protein [Aequorivita sp. CIP111184]|uniref:Rho termination factor N-terminal domain-containing protein n=1 Tax=Aequorivita sp. CIP111184 TaxID=2211356 RepID=UPI000DBC1580|nr:hypothetical protein AEQU1_01471 [Aequorivita sp. CIP111184]
MKTSRRHCGIKDIAKNSLLSLQTLPILEIKDGEAKPYNKWTKKELYEQAKNVGIEGRSKMKKKELILPLRNN